MIKPEFEDYLNEYAAEGVGILIYSLVTNIVLQTVHKYPPEIYSPSRSVWDDDATNDIVHRFILDWLLIKGRLEYYLLSLQGVDGLRYSIRRELRMYLINCRRRDEYSNLFKRVKKAFERTSWL